ncbi:MAG: GNAT family N-acetyltransferase [Ignavibacteria bacterium]|nr:GNAT family N-acetyltransferase [Ignavibacteria bacterium]
MNNDIPFSSRIKLLPLSRDEMFLYIKDDNELTDKLSLNPGKRVISRGLLNSFKDPILKYIDENPDYVLFAVIWLVIDSRLNRITGHFHFKGNPDKDGMTEIGYRIYDEFQNNGYATEALGLIIQWAFSDENVKIINAFTEINNFASQKVLEKCGFKIYNKSESEIEWRKMK